MAEVWPYVPLSEMEDRPTWMTVAHQREDNTVRWSLRNSRQVLVYNFAFTALRYEEARTLFKSNVLGEWHVPCWAEATRGVAVSSADTTLSVSTDAEYVVGGLAIIWGNCDTFTVATVDAVGDGSIDLSAAVGADYASAVVMPCRVCIAREGAETGRTAQRLFSMSIAFEAKDNPDLSLYTGGKVQAHIAVDTSGSMESAGIVAVIGSQSATGFDMGVASAANLLWYLQATGIAHDIRIVGFASSVSSIERTDCDETDYDDLRAFLAGLTAGGTTTTANSVNGASAFFSGDGRQVFAAFTDAGSSVITAAVGEAISDLEIYVADPTALATSEDATFVSGTYAVDAGHAGLRDIVAMGLLGLPSYEGALVFECSGAILEAQGGRIFQTAAYVDSGFGVVAVETDRSFLEEVSEITVAESTPAARFELKRKLHILRGSDRPFWITESIHRIVGSATTYVRVEAGRRNVSEWAGKIVEIDGVVLTVVGGSLVSGTHQLSINDLPTSPAGPLRVLRRVRQATDETVVQQHRRGGWSRFNVPVVTA